MRSSSAARQILHQRIGEDRDRASASGRRSTSSGAITLIFGLPAKRAAIEARTLAAESHSSSSRAPRRDEIGMDRLAAAVIEHARIRAAARTPRAARRRRGNARPCGARSHRSNGRCPRIRARCVMASATAVVSGPSAPNSGSVSRQRHARDRVERAGVLGAGAAAEIVVAVRRIGADHQQVGRRRQALMAGAGRQHRDVAGLDLQFLAPACRRSARAPCRPRCRALRGSASGSARTDRCRCATCRGPSRSCANVFSIAAAGSRSARHRSRRDRPGTAAGCSAPRRRRRSGSARGSMAVVATSRSLLLALAHQAGEAVEQIVAVARAGRGFRVVLHREHRPVLQRDAAVRAVEQRDVRLLDVRRQRFAGRPRSRGSSR